jgi:hypothetical protein
MNLEDGVGNRCKVCGGPTRKGDRLNLCQRCKGIRTRVDPRRTEPPNYDARVKALQESWKAGDGRFICMYSRVPVLTDTKDHKMPLYLSLDHRTPRGEDDYVVTCRLVNDMKNIMEDVEFRQVVVGLAAVFKSGAGAKVPDLEPLFKRIKRGY